MRSLLALLFVSLAVPALGDTRDSAGDAVFRERCAQCHQSGVDRAPDLAALRRLSPERVRAALSSGSMSVQAQGLTAVQLDAVIGFVAGGTSEAASPKALCSDPQDPPQDPFAQPHWNGWGVSASQRRFQPEAMAALPLEQVPRLKLKWAFGFPGDNRAYAQPTVVGGRLFVGSAGGKVYSLDAKSGCTHWIFDAGAPVRSAISIGIDGGVWRAYFGDQHGNAYAVDGLNGKLLWKTRPERHPAAIITGAPTLSGGIVYVPVSSSEELAGANPQYQCCSFRGSIAALDAADGKMLWQGYTIRETPQPVRKNQIGTQLWGPAGAPVWSAPTVDPEAKMIYVTTGDNYADPPVATSDAFLALRSETGELAWSRQMTEGDAYNVACGSASPVNCPVANGPDFDFGSSPMLVKLPDGRRALVAGQKSGMVYAVDPDRQGTMLWQRRLGAGGKSGGIQWGSAADQEKVYVAVSDARRRAAAAAAPGAQKTLFGPSVLLDPEAGGGLYALALETGEVVWHTPHPGCNNVPGCSPAQSAAVTVIPGVVFSGGLDGHLRAYASEDGRIVWDIDTKGAYQTINGVSANGGSIDGPGPVIVGGMLYVESGYAFLGGTPGNVLLAFSVDGH